MNWNNGIAFLAVGAAVGIVVANTWYTHKSSTPPPQQQPYHPPVHAHCSCMEGGGSGMGRSFRLSTPEGQMMCSLVNGSNSVEGLRRIMRGNSMEDVVHCRSQNESFSNPHSPQLTHSFNVEDVVAATKAEFATRKSRTPKEVLLELQRGNGRFWMGLSQRPELNAMERRALIIAQAPSVAILGCSDSRVPVEIVFDQGLGDIFVVRVAGNVLDDATHGSIEYAVVHLKVKVLMVLGHEGCGAVKAALTLPDQDVGKEPGHLQKVIHSIKSNLVVDHISHVNDHRAREREAVVSNCTAQVHKLLENEVVNRLVQEGQLLVCGAFYEITSGIVDFFSYQNGLVIDF